ncbi:MAG: UxaA family hydrolase, partial [Bacteroidales bacterium]|nr:UxaA family hydrolase [Bacteroidales bacterium]
MKALRINPVDNVAVALQDLPKGEIVEGVRLLEEVPRGHKIALADLPEGENVIKYGYPIGHVTRDVAAGSKVDHSCIKTNLEGLLDYTYEPALVEIPAAAHKRTFKGFRRADGQVGIRNQIWVI